MCIRCHVCHIILVRSYEGARYPHHRSCKHCCDLLSLFGGSTRGQATCQVWHPLYRRLLRVCYVSTQPCMGCQQLRCDFRFVCKVLLLTHDPGNETKRAIGMGMYTALGNMGNIAGKTFFLLLRYSMLTSCQAPTSTPLMKLHNSTRGTGFVLQCLLPRP